MRCGPSDAPLGGDRIRGVKCAGLSDRGPLRPPEHGGECAREVAEETEFTNEGTKGNEDDTEKTAGTQGRDRASSSPFVLR